MKIPDGHYVDGMIIWNALDRSGYASKGFELMPPDLRNASVAIWYDYENRIRRLMTMVQAPARIQWQWSVDSDYADELEAYRSRFNGQEVSELAALARDEIYLRYWRRMQEGSLRRERLRLYITLPIETSRLETDFKEGPERDRFYRTTLAGLRSHFNTQLHLLQHLFDASAVVPMDDEKHYNHHLAFFNPSLAGRVTDAAHFDPARSVQQNTLKSGVVGNCARETKDYHLFSDGFYQKILTVSRWPAATYPSIVYALTGLDFLDYSITVNCHTREARAQIRQEEKDIQRLRGDLAADPKKVSLEEAIAQKVQRVRNLSSGFTQAMTVEYYIRVWATTQEELSGKTTAIKTALSLMEGCQCWEPTLASQAVNLYSQTVPGWSFGKYSVHGLYAESDYIAAMMPLSATFVGHLHDAEALYDGDNSNLVGIRNFIGSTPQHGAMFGMSGCGKSAWMVSLLTQTDPYYDYTVIIEEGMSYGLFTVALGYRPIVIHTDSDLTINYFDTHGLPLSASQIANATALVSQMCGKADTSERENLRYAMIMHYIEEAYQDAYEQWSQEYPGKVIEIARHAIVCADVRASMGPGTTPLDAFVEVRTLGEDHPSELERRLDAVTDDQITRFCTEHDKALRDHAFGWFTPEDFPVHSQLQEIMFSRPSSRHDLDTLNTVATLISAWNDGGAYGCLFDGVTNVELTGRMAHFELGYISEGTPELKQLAAFLITNYTRQHIMSLPRRAKKRFVFEEAGRLLDMPGGEKMIAEAYAQLRKYSCWTVSIVQQFALFKNSAIRPIVMGNSRQFLMMRQGDRQDLEELASRDHGGLDLPEVTRDAIMSYPTPDALPEGYRYASATYYHQGAGLPHVGTIRNHCSPEMLYIASSSGEAFDERMRSVRSRTGKMADSPMEAIIECAAREFASEDFDESEQNAETMEVTL